MGTILTYTFLLVRLTFGDSIADMAQKSRNEWVLQWPGQIVIAGCQTFWTAEVEKAILSSSLNEFFAIMLELVCNLSSLNSYLVKKLLYSIEL